MEKELFFTYILLIWWLFCDTLCKIGIGEISVQEFSVSSVSSLCMPGTDMMLNSLHFSQTQEISSTYNKIHLPIAGREKLLQEGACFSPLAMKGIFGALLSLKHLSSKRPN